MRLRESAARIVGGRNTMLGKVQSRVCFRSSCPMSREESLPIADLIGMKNEDTCSPGRGRSSKKDAKTEDDRRSWHKDTSDWPSAKRMLSVV